MGAGADGSSIGHHRACGIRPAKADRFYEHGLTLPASWFEEGDNSYARDPGQSLLDSDPAREEI